MKTMTHLQGSHSGSPETNFLKHLSVLIFYDGEEELLFGGEVLPFSMEKSCSSIVPFVALPSLRMIQGYSNDLGSFKDYAFADNHGLHPSPVTDINFEDSNLEADCVDGAFLQYMQVLKRFTYNQIRRHPRICGGEEPARIIQSLLARASGSLESLALTGFTAYRRPEPQDPQVSVKGFKVLKEIHFSVDLAFIAIGDWTKSEPDTTPNNAISPLVDVLPASVETVRLDGVIDWSALADLLVGLPERKAECLPRLKEIFFDLNSDFECREDSEEWASLHQEEGIVLQLDSPFEEAPHYEGRIIF